MIRYVVYFLKPVFTDPKESLNGMEKDYWDQGNFYFHKSFSGISSSCGEL